MTLTQIILLTCVTPVLTLTWIKVSLSPPFPQERRDAAIGYHDNSNSLILFGGRGERERLFSDTWIFNITQGQWTEVTQSTRPPPRFGVVSGVSGTYFYITTGEGVNGVFYNDVWRLDLSNYTWLEMPVPSKSNHISLSQLPTLPDGVFTPSPRYGAAGGIHPDGHRLYVSLGFSTQRYLDTLVYDTNSMRWYNDYECTDCNPYNPSYPHARRLHSGAMIGPDELVIFGGCLSGGMTGGPCPSGDSWVYSSANKQWTQLYDCPTPRMYSGLASLPTVGDERRAVLYGGVVADRQVIRTRELREDEVGILDPTNLTWTVRLTKTNMSVYPTVRASMAMTSAPDGVYMFGGVEVKGSGLLNDLWLLEGDSYTADQSETLSCGGSGFFNLAMIHGICMVIGWGVCLLWGAFIARYLKSLGPYWFYAHVSLQVLGLCCAVAGLVFAVLSVKYDHFNFAHGIIGMIAMILAVYQPVNAIFRPSRPQPNTVKSWRRRVWEVAHHLCGLFAVALGLVNISLGVFFTLASSLIYGLWFAYLILVVIIWLSAEGTVRCRRFLSRHGLNDDTKFIVGVNGDLNEDDRKVPVNSGFCNDAMVCESSRL